MLRQLIRVPKSSVLALDCFSISAEAGAGNGRWRRMMSPSSLRSSTESSLRSFSRGFAAKKGKGKDDEPAEESEKRVSSSKKGATPLEKLFGATPELKVNFQDEATFSDEALELKNRQVAEIRAMSEEAQLKRIADLERNAAEHLTMERFEEAEQMLDTSMSVRERLFPADDLETAKQRLNFAFALHNTGKRDEAAKNYESAIAALRKQLKPTDYKIGEGLLNYAEVLSLLNRSEDAVTASRESIEILKKNFAPDSEYIGAALNNLGSYLAVLKRFDEALPVVEEAVSILKKALGADANYTQSAVVNQIQLLKDLNREEEAEKLKKEWEESAKGFKETVTGIELDPNMLANFEKQMQEQLQAPKEFDLRGFFKDKEMSKQEISKFVDYWLETHPNLDPVHFRRMIEEVELINAVQNGDAASTTTAPSSQ